MSVQCNGLRRNEGIFLICVTLLTLLASSYAGYLGYQRNTALAAIEYDDDDDDRSRVPLPAGPRKYQ